MTPVRVQVLPQHRSVHARDNLTETGSLRAAGVTPPHFLDQVEKDMVEAAGVELFRRIENKQVIDN